VHLSEASSAPEPPFKCAHALLLPPPRPHTFFVHSHLKLSPYFSLTLSSSHTHKHTRTLEHTRTTLRCPACAQNYSTFTLFECRRPLSKAAQNNGAPNEPITDEHLLLDDNK